MELKNPRTYSPSTISSMQLSAMKPLILYSQTYTKDTAKQFKKFLPRYTHKMRVAWDDHKLVQNVKHLKLVQAVEVVTHFYLNNRRRAIKAVKPLQKHIKQVLGPKHDPNGLLFHLPYLSKYRLTIDTPETHKPFIYCQKVTELVIYWPTDTTRHSENSFLEIIEEFKGSFNRIVKNFKRVQHLNLWFGTPVDESLGWFGDLFGPHFHHFRSLKTFALRDDIGALLCSPKIDNQGLQSILSQVTHFDMYSGSPVDLKSNAGPNTLENLIDLTFNTICFEESEMADLAHLTDFKHLRRLTLSSDLHQLMFFKHFTLPKSLEFIKLTIKTEKNEKCSELNIDYNAFVQQWAGMERLRELRLILVNKSYPFIMTCEQILRQLSHLETFYYQHIDYNNATNGFLYLGYLWNGLRSSRKTLQTVGIKALDISLSDITNMNFDLPQLKSLYVESVNEKFKETIVGKMYACWNMLRFLKESLNK